MNDLISKKQDNPKYRPLQHCNENGFFDGIDIFKTLYKGRPSENSLTFTNNPQKAKEAIKKAFGITDPTFEEMFREACSGKGMEERRIATLHSSSLLSMLFFHSVNEDNPITIDCGNGEKGRFTAKRFEYQNPIVPGHPSNIDVMLTDTDRAVTLFLESKYSEYLDNGKYSEISREVYLKYYEELLPTLESIGLTMKKNGTEFFDLCAPSGRTLHYAGGIKQMISHWLGAIIYAEGHKDETVMLGETVFDFGEDSVGALRKYKNDYAILAKGLNKSSRTPSNLLALPEIMTYQQLFENNPHYSIQKRIVEYYNL